MTQTYASGWHATELNRMTTHTTIAHRLYTLATQADARLSAVIAARTAGARDRWTLTAEEERIPEIRAAYRAKVTADAAWLTYLRVSCKR